MFLSKVGIPCPTLGQLVACRILYAHLVGEKQHEIARAILLYKELLKSWSSLGQFLANFPFPWEIVLQTLTYSSPLATPNLELSF